jgi:integral membrane protein (TIGR01906 family)
MKQLISGLVTLLVPVVLILSATRFLLTPLFVNLEYRTPGFPEDTYGMTMAQRLEYAPLALDYLLNDEGIAFLGDQRFLDGTPLYNERELSHMEDVKELTQIVLKVWVNGLIGLGLLALAAWCTGAWTAFRSGLSRGGLLTVILIVGLLVFLALSFDVLFTEFHHLFFEGDSWLFLYSDTLIRLFPIRFWRDVFLTLGVFSLGGGLLLWRYAPPQAAAKTHTKKTSRK